MQTNNCQGPHPDAVLRLQYRRFVASHSLKRDPPRNITDAGPANTSRRQSNTFECVALTPRSKSRANGQMRCWRYRISLAVAAAPVRFESRCLLQERVQARKQGISRHCTQSSVAYSTMLCGASASTRGAAAAAPSAGVFSTAV